MQLPDGSVHQVELAFVDRLAGFTLHFETLIRAFRWELPFRAVSYLAGVSMHRVMSLYERYVEYGGRTTGSL